MTQNEHHHRPLMVQAPVRALDPDGVAVVSAGTVAFAVAAVVCWLGADTLTASGRLWYLGVSISGTLLGLMGLGVGLYRKAARRRELAPGGQRSVEEALVDTDGVPDRE